MKKNKKYNLPDDQGNFGQFGGGYVPEALAQILKELNATYLELRESKSFQNDVQDLYQNYVGRPSLLYHAKNLTKQAGGAQIYLKREDLNHTGAHKINNTVGQALLAKHMGKTKLIAETGAGQHGVATATVAALMGLECDVYMGARDVKNQNVNVYRMKLLGARVIEVHDGQATLKDAVDAALSAYINETDVYYMLGSVVGPHPYPMMVRDFQKVIGQEVRQQMTDLTGHLPDALVACIGGGSNAMGLFYDFIEEKSVRMICVEPAGEGSQTDRHGLALGTGQPGVIHGYKCLVLQDEQGNIKQSYSAASGLDYPGVGPEPSYLYESGRLEVVGATDQQATDAFQNLSRTEGIIPALESAHAIAYGLELAAEMDSGQSIVINLSGRGDKDVQNVHQMVSFIKKSKLQ